MAALNDAARAFREFFGELREAFHERDTLLTQIELALLCKEHVLVTGPPGTAKSAIASAVLGRITDEKTGQPSLFAKQISELTVQTDLIGSVDFKVLTETGRTEYLTDDGILGATHAFLDEVFDGRDMLLRSILNVLHERELKHGRKVKAGRTECAIMTTNRYLSEVLARSPELLLAFADRLSFICFIPKGFARTSSRAAMLVRAGLQHRIELHRAFTLQQLDELQRATEQVQAPPPILEALELLSDGLERELQKHASRMPDYVPTKYFSNRSVVKGLWALKAAVVRDLVYRDPERALVADVSDLAHLRHFFLLGGPPPKDLEVLLKSVVDPRERAQLEIIQVEHKAFDEVLSRIGSEVSTGRSREAESLEAKDDFTLAEALLLNFGAEEAEDLARRLLEKLHPGPRHPQNREAVLAAARTFLGAVEGRLQRGGAGQGEGRGGSKLVRAITASLELARRVPELSPHSTALSERALVFARDLLELGALNAEGVEWDVSFRADQLATFAANLDEELLALRVLIAEIGRAAPSGIEEILQKELEVRARASASLRRCAERSVLGKPRDGADLEELLSVQSQKLGELEDALVRLDPRQRGLKQALLHPLAQRYAHQLLSTAAFERLEELGQVVLRVRERLRREGLQADALLAGEAETIAGRVRGHVALLSKQVQSARPGPAQVLSGEAYARYRQTFVATRPEGEYRGLLGLDGALGESAATVLTRELRAAIASAELGVLEARVGYLSAWLGELMQSAPPFDGLVQSRFPLLVFKEGELNRLQHAVELISSQEGEAGQKARALEAAVRGIAERFGEYGRRLLEARAQG